jgi:hypothetical protein
MLRQSPPAQQPRVAHLVQLLKVEACRKQQQGLYLQCMLTSNWLLRVFHVEQLVVCLFTQHLEFAPVNKDRVKVRCILPNISCSHVLVTGFYC